jgi:molybdate transport system substrate-binding protein
MKGRSRNAVVAAFCLLALAGCTRSRKPVELMFFCGAGLRQAAEELIDTFETRETVTMQTTYDGSGKLLAQVTALKRGDLFMPGEAFYVQKAQEQGLIAESTIDSVCYFVPVLFVRKGNPAGVKSLGDLARSGVRVGLGDERSCAVGREATALLQRAGVDRQRVERNVSVRTGTVAELATAVQLSLVDAAVVWQATARQFREHGEIVWIPAETAGAIAVPIAVMKSTEHRIEAERFIEFLKSRTAKDIFIRHGYDVERPSGA